MTNNETHHEMFVVNDNDEVKVGRIRHVECLCGWRSQLVTSFKSADKEAAAHLIDCGVDPKAKRGVYVETELTGLLADQLNDILNGGTP